MQKRNHNPSTYYQLGNVDVDKIWGHEDWVASAHLAGVSTIDLKHDETLSQIYSEPIAFDLFYQNHKDLLGITAQQFPLLVKILTAVDDLSIQVHPDDKYAQLHENSLGKTECWYILDAAPNANIIVGQTAHNKEELATYINTGQILEHLKIIPVKAGDFIFIPAGTVHAICKNTKLIEIQQSSDITYRLYDYDRTDDYGQKRELHIEKSLDVIDFTPKVYPMPLILENNSNYTQTLLTAGDFFYVHKYDVMTRLSLITTTKFKLLIIISGQVQINNNILSPYQTILIPINQSLEIVNMASTESQLIVTGI